MLVDVPLSKLDGRRVLALAGVDDSAVFTGRLSLNVDGEWLGRVPCLPFARMAKRRSWCFSTVTSHGTLLGSKARTLQGPYAPASVEKGDIA